MALHPVAGPPVITNVDTELWFGRYKGFKIKDILHDDPAYLVWAQTAIKDFDLHQMLLEQAENYCVEETPFEKHSGYFWR